jgi:hypothetical protein
MALPPNAYRADERAILEHFELIASVGLPVTAYNNPIDTKVDLTPDILAKLHAEGLIVGVKEFSGDVRRCYEITELAPGLDLMIGTDDTVLEVGIAGAVGWSPATRRSSRRPARSSSASPSPVTSRRRCRSTASCTRCCAGTPRRSSSRPSSSGRT